MPLGNSVPGDEHNAYSCEGRDAREGGVHTCISAPRQRIAAGARQPDGGGRYAAPIAQDHALPDTDIAPGTVNTSHPHRSPQIEKQRKVAESNPLPAIPVRHHRRTVVTSPGLKLNVAAQRRLLRAIAVSHFRPGTIGCSCGIHYSSSQVIPRVGRTCTERS